MAKMKRIIVKPGKHNTDYYDASTEAEYKKSMEKIFEDHDRQEFYYNLKEEKYYLKDVEEYKNKILRQEEQKQLHLKYNETHEAERVEEYIKRLKEQAKDLEVEKKLYDRAINGEFAALERLLKKRSDAQYEGYDLEEIQ